MVGRHTETTSNIKIKKGLDLEMARYCANENHMVDSGLIRAAMSAQNITIEALADRIGRSRHTVMSHLRNGDWSVLEAWLVSQVLGLDFDKTFLAFPEKVA